MSEYIIRRVDSVPTVEEWKLADIADVSLKPWEETSYHFNCFARVLYDDVAIYVQMETNEMPVVAKQTERNSLICTDSCVEFFFCPNIENGIYFNFEVNALGTFLVGVGKERKDRILCMDDADLFDIKPQLCQDGWEISFQIPFDFIRKYAGGCTPTMRGNFYKCGSDTGHRHFGVWNMIKTEKPNFYQPEYFGDLIFEK